MAALNSTITTRQAREDRAIYRAMGLLESRLRKPGKTFNEPRSVRQFLALHLARCECEVFFALWLDTQHRLITAEVCSVGTLSQTCLYSREVAKAALRVNASALILAHNHPGGSCEPSPADVALTKHIRNTLSFIDVRVLDHFIVTNESIYSLTAGRLVQ